ncbi:MAG: RNA methyltransferase [Chloroflexi bacterium]|nr:MAG: RNA methyltransferase [Chloroflexota bacterium]
MLAGRLRVPEVLAASSADAAIGAQDFPVLLTRESPQRLADLTKPRDLALFVGPEGGWTERELELGVITASLGPRNMRAETAALVGLAVALAARPG